MQGKDRQIDRVYPLTQAYPGESGCGTWESALCLVCSNAGGKAIPASQAHAETQNLPPHSTGWSPKWEELKLGKLFILQAN